MARVKVVKVGWVSIPGPPGPPGDASAPGGVGTPQLAAGAVIPQKTSFIVPGKNLYDAAAATVGQLLNGFGNLVSSASYTTSDYIPVTAGQPYTFSATGSFAGPRALAFYDVTKTFVQYIDNGGTQPLTTRTPAQDGYVRVSWNGTVTPQVEAGSVKTTYESYRLLLPKAQFGAVNLRTGSITEAAVAARSVTPNKTTFYGPGKNLFDPDTITPDVYVQEANGLEAAFAGYLTSDWIPVSAGQPYTVSQARKIVLYDSERAYVSGANYLQSGGARTVTPTVDGYLRFSVDTANPAYTPHLQVEVGSVATVYEPFARTIPGLSFTPAQKAEITGASALASPVTVTKAGPVLNIVGDLGGKVLGRNVNLSGSANGAFTFTNTTLDGLAIHATTDDITPIRLPWTTVGANHGYTTISRYTVAGHDKTTADLGSRWTDGTRTYTLLQISGNDLIFGHPYTTDGNGFVTGGATPPAATLTHTSGAIHTTSVPITSPVANPQLYPSIARISVTADLDDALVTADGTYRGDALRITEQYDILDYGAIVAWAQANIGQSFAANADSIAGLVRIRNVFTFGEQGRCLVSASLTALKAVTLGNTGFLQSVALGASGYTTYRAMPRVKAKSGIDFGQPVDLTSYATSLTFGASDYLTTGKPPAWYADWLVSGGTTRVGFAMGYLIDKTNSKDADRAALSIAWDMRNTKKSYPVALTGVTLAAGEHRSVEGFRTYLAPHPSGATAVAVIEDAQAAYAYLLYHAPITAAAVPLPDQIGRPVTAVDSAGLTVANATVDASGVTVTVPGASGHAVVKLG